MRLKKVLSVLLVACVASGTALADEPYLFDLLKQAPYRAAWDAMFKGEKKIPGWIITFGKTYDGVASPGRTVEVDGQNDLLASVCKPHDCGDNQLFVLFAPDAAEAWGMLLAGGNNPRWFGAPGDAVKAVLAKAPEMQ